MQVIQFNASLEFKPSHYFLLPELEACDIRNKQFYDHMKNNSNYCNVRRIRHTNQIVPLMESKYFIYIVKQTVIELQCGDKSTSYNTSKSMIVSNLHSDCSIKMDQSHSLERRNASAGRISRTARMFQTYSLTNNDLIQKDERKYNITELRNLQSEYGNLEEKVRKVHPIIQFIHKPENGENLIYVLLAASLFTIVVCIIYKKKRTIQNKLVCVFRGARIANLTSNL